MKRAFVLGLGMAWVSSAGAADPLPVTSTVIPVRQPAATKPAERPDPVKRPFLTSQVKAEAVSPPLAGIPDDPTAPVAQPGPEGIDPLATPGVVGTSVAGCTTCGTADGTRPKHGGKLANWLLFRPGPAVLPRCQPTPYQAPLLSYFPVRVPPPAPAPEIVIKIGGPSILPNAAVPRVFTETPTPMSIEPAAQDPKSSGNSKPSPAPVSDSDEKPSAMFPNWHRKAADEVETPRQRVIDELLELFGHSGEAGPVDPSRVIARGATPSDDPPERTDVQLVTPVPSPGVTPPPSTAVSGFEDPTGCPTCGTADPALMLAYPKVFKKCRHYSSHTPCTGHGDLTGYRFAMPIMTPCPPLRPLFVKDCFGFAGDCGSGCAPGHNPEAIHVPVVGSAPPTVSHGAVIPAAAKSISPAGLPVSRPLSQP